MKTICKPKEKPRQVQKKKKKKKRGNHKHVDKKILDRHWLTYHLLRYRTLIITFYDPRQAVVDYGIPW